MTATSGEPPPAALAATSANGWRHVLAKWVLRGSVALLLGSLLGFGGELFWVLDLFSQFRQLYVGAALLLWPLAWLSRERRSALALFVVVAINVPLMAVFYTFPRAQVPVTAPRLRLLHFNVQLENREHLPQIARYVERSGADVVLLVETDAAWVRGLTPALPHYQLLVSSTAPFLNHYFGTCLFLRRAAAPLVTASDAHETFLEHSAGHPALQATLSFAGRPIALLGVHQHPPISGVHARIRDEQFRQTERWVSQHGSARIVLGDMNATPWSLPYRQLVAGTGLGNAQRGFGLTPTWLPLHGSFLGVPIDHCLHSPDLVVSAFERGPDLHSDHRPLRIELAWAP